jgi:hypothetical protein
MLPADEHTFSDELHFQDPVHMGQQIQILSAPTKIPLITTNVVCHQPLHCYQVLLVGLLLGIHCRRCLIELADQRPFSRCVVLTGFLELSDAENWIFL